MHRLRQLGRALRRVPRCVRAPHRTHLGHNRYVPIRVQRLTDDLIGDMRAVEVAGVDVIDASGNRLPQYGNCRRTILRRTPYVRTGKLHRSIANAIQGDVRTRKCNAAPKFFFIQHASLQQLVLELYVIR